jgi:hypothetical protein
LKVVKEGIGFICLLTEDTQVADNSNIGKNKEDYDIGNKKVPNILRHFLVFTINRNNDRLDHEAQGKEANSIQNIAIIKVKGNIIFLFDIREASVLHQVSNKQIGNK